MSRSPGRRVPRQAARSARREARGQRTYDGTTGRLLGDTSPSASDYIDYQLDPLSDPTLAFDTSTAAPTGTPMPTGIPSATGSPPVLPQVTVTATPLTSASGPLGIPWWAWAVIGIVGGYFIARNYGKHISRGLETASRIAHPV